jgi:hypothetical protein
VIVLANVSELTLLGVADRGIANKERVILRANQDVDMSPFALLAGLNLGAAGRDNPTQPLNDHFFWFGDAVIDKGDFILVYSGQGDSVKTTLEGSDDPAYVLHWNKPTTLFARTLVVPVLVRIGAFSIVQPPADQPQRKAITSSGK